MISSYLRPAPPRPNLPALAQLANTGLQESLLLEPKFTPPATLTEAAGWLHGDTYAILNPNQPLSTFRQHLNTQLLAAKRLLAEGYDHATHSMLGYEAVVTPNDDGVLLRLSVRLWVAPKEGTL